MAALSFTLCLLSVFLTMGEGQMSELFNRFMGSYTNQNFKLLRPSGKDNDTLQVSVGLSLVDIISVDVETGLVDLEMYYYLSWYDGRLRFRPSYGITSLFIPNNMIWKPDIVPYRGNIHDSFEDYNALVSHNGTVLIAPKINYKLRCDVGVARGSIHCLITLGSWTMDRRNIDLQLMDGDLVLTDFHAHRDWRVSETQARLDLKYYSSGPYVNVKFSFNLGVNTGCQPK